MFDEFPERAYATSLSHRLEGAVTYLLKRHDDLPFSDYTNLVENRHDDTWRTAALC